MSTLKARQPLRRRAASRPAPAQPISVDEAHRQYEGEWAIMKVTAVDEQQLPSRGEIVAHSPSHAAIWKKFTKLVPQSEPADSLYYLFSAAPRIRTGEELRQALEEAAERGVVRAWPRW